MTKAPYVKKHPTGTVRYKWRICPYADCDLSDRIPINERTSHTVTSGYMTLDLRGGHDGAGWRCDDPNCPYFLGNAVTPIAIAVREVSIDYTTGEYTITTTYKDTLLCSGIKFWEK